MERGSFVGKTLTTCTRKADSVLEVYGVRKSVGCAHAPTSLAERLELAGALGRVERLVRYEKIGPDEHGRHGCGAAEAEPELLVPTRPTLEVGETAEEEGREAR